MNRALWLAAALVGCAGAVSAVTLREALELHRQGRLEEALEGYRQVLAADPGEAERATAHNAACAALNDLGRFAEALGHCERAERLRRDLGAGAELADTLNNRALSLDALGRPEEAEAAYEEALDIYRQRSGAEDQAFVLSNLASLAIGRGDFGAALERLDEAERLALSAAEEPWAEEELRVARINRAVTLERLGAYREALAELRSAPPGPGASGEEAALRAVNVAVLYRNLGDPWRALARLDEAARLLAGHPDPSIESTIEINRGLVALHGLRDPAAAREAFERALERARSSGDRKEEGRALVALGRAELALGDAAAAGAAFEGALASTESTGSAETRWTAHGGLARAALAGGDPERAEALYTLAVRDLEEAGAGVESGALREGLMADQREIFAGAVDLAAGRAARGDAEAALAALELSERARARELLAALAGPAASEPLAGADLAAAAGRFAPALVYFAGNERLWRFRLEVGGAIRVEDAGPAETALDRARALHETLAAGRPPEPGRLEEAAALLLPGDLGTTRRLRVVPDSALYYLPFEMLPGSSGRPLGETTAIAYAPSLSTLARIGSTPRPEPRWNLLAFADPALDPPALTNGSTPDLLAARFGLPPLPGAREEAASAAARLGSPSRVEVGPTATERAFREQAGAGARVLLLSAHTLVDERIEGGVAIFLAPGGGDDGALGAAELARARIPADLAVLSGCRTALAGRRDGRSMATLAGAMLGAGARGVVSTLWEVDDQDARAVVDGLVWELARGVEPAEALRRAKRRVADDPRWAGRVDSEAFVLMGDPSPLPARRGGLGWAAAAALLLALATALAARVRRAT